MGHQRIVPIETFTGTFAPSKNGQNYALKTMYNDYYSFK